MPRPTLVVVSGPSGAGKTTLAHALARAVGCPAVCRDEIKEGMVHADPDTAAAPGDPLSIRTLGTFFDALALLLRAEVTVVAEAAFRDRVWRPRLTPLAELADLRIVKCSVDAEAGIARRWQRLADDPTRRAHADEASLAEGAGAVRYYAEFDHGSLPVPTLEVDTTDGYRPGLSAVVEFAAGRNVGH